MTERRYPYNVLGKFTIHTRSSIQEIQKIFPMTREEREAWDMLRYPRSRLKADFFLYQIQNEERLLAFQERVRSIATPPTVTEVVNLLRADAPVILVLMGERGEARRIWEDLQQQNPANTHIAHQLALCSYAEAQHYEETGDYDRATAAWHLTIANWVCTLVDDEYWNNWCREREWDYGDRLNSEVQEAVRQDLYKHLAREFAEYADRYWRAGNEERAQIHRHLEILYTIEWQSAQALKAAGGLGTDAGQTIICGAWLLQQLKLEQRLSQFIAELQKALDRYAALSLAQALAQQDSEPRVSSEVVQQLHITFSELAPVAAFLTLHKPDMAVKYLPATRRVPVDFDQKNFAYSHLSAKVQKFREDAATLAIQAYLAIACQHITAAAPDWRKASEAWQAALRRGREGGIEKEAVKTISDLAIGRARSLENETEREEIVRLNEAVALLETAHAVLGNADAGVVTAALADTLLERSYWYWDQADNIRAAAEDRRRAFQLRPDDVIIRDKYCTVLVHCARDRVREGHKEEAVTLLERVKSLVQAGLQEHPANASLQETLQWVQQELDVLAGKNITDAAWREVEEVLQGFKQPADENQQVLWDLIESAERKRKKGEYAAAIADLEQAPAIDAASAWVKTEMARTYGMWAKELLEDGYIKEAEEKCSLGTQYQPEERTVREMQQAIQMTRDLLGDEET